MAPSTRVSVSFLVLAACENLQAYPDTAFPFAFNFYSPVLRCLFDSAKQILSSLLKIQSVFSQESFMGRAYAIVIESKPLLISRISFSFFCHNLQLKGLGENTCTPAVSSLGSFQQESLIISTFFFSFFIKPKYLSQVAVGYPLEGNTDMFTELQCYPSFCFFCDLLLRVCLH